CGRPHPVIWTLACLFDPTLSSRPPQRCHRDRPNAVISTASTLSSRPPQGCHFDRPKAVISTAPRLSFRPPQGCHFDRPKAVISTAGRNLLPACEEQISPCGRNDSFCAEAVDFVSILAPKSRPDGGRQELRGGRGRPPRFCPQSAWRRRNAGMSR